PGTSDGDDAASLAGIVQAAEVLGLAVTVEARRDGQVHVAAAGRWHGADIDLWDIICDPDVIAEAQRLTAGGWPRGDAQRGGGGRSGRGRPGVWLRRRRGPGRGRVRPAGRRVDVRSEPQARPRPDRLGLGLRPAELRRLGYRGPA